MSVIASPIYKPAGGIITLSGDSALAQNFAPSQATSGFEFRSTGGVYRNTNEVFLQLDALTDWIDNKGLAPGLFEILLTVLSGSAPSLGPAIDDYHALTSNRSWRLISTSGTESGQWRASIRKNGGPVLATGDYSATATVI